MSDPDAISVSTPSKVIGAEVLVAAAFVAASFAMDAAGRVLCAIGLVGALLLLVRDLSCRPVLRADTDGLWLRRVPWRTEHYDWSQVERIEVAGRSHLGHQARTLDLELTDQPIVFGRYRLDAELGELAATLRRLQHVAGGART